MINRKELKADARLAMREHKPSIFLVALVYILAYMVLEGLSVKLNYPGRSFNFNAVFAGQFPEPGFFNISPIARALDLAIAIILAVLGLGFTNACLQVSRRQAAGVGSLFDTFGFFFKIVWLNIVTRFFIFLWTLLFVIPGIVAGCRYSMAPYLLLEDPDRSIMDCLRESKFITAGHKWELFVLHLSFIGWSLLALIPVVAIYVKPYIKITMANYYNVLSGYQPEETQEAPQDGGWWN